MRGALLEDVGRFLDQQADLPMSGVITQGPGMAVRPAQPTHRAQDQILRLIGILRVPAHAHILGQAKEIAAGTIEQHLLVNGQAAHRTLALESGIGQGFGRT